MSGMNVLFGGGGSGDAATGIDAVVEAAETAYEESLADGGDGSAEVDLLADEDVVDAPAADPAVPAEGDDADQDDVEGDADDDAADDEGVDESDAADDTPAEIEAALHFRDQLQAEKAYYETRSQLNKLQNQIITGGNNQPMPVAPQPSQQDIVAVAGQDPAQAFAMALQSGDTGLADQLLARTATDAAKMAAQAGMLTEEGNADQAALWESRAQNAAMLAEQMRNQRSQAEYQRNLQPMIDMEAHRAKAEYDAAYTAAAQRAVSRPAYQGIDLTPYGEQIAAYVAEHPHIMGPAGQHTHESLEQGFATAVNEVVFARNRDAVLATLVPAGAPPAPRRASRGTGGGAGRKSPVERALTPDEEEAAELTSGLANIPQNGMNVLFGRG